MLPKLRVIFATVIAACAVALAISAGVVATRNPSDRLTGVPSMSQPLVQQAIVEDADREHSRLLAYSRRADELSRLRELPTAPARAVIEYAERAQRQVDDAAHAPLASPPVPTTSDTQPAAAPDAATTVASTLAEPATPPASPSAASAAAGARVEPQAPQPSPAVVASVPVAPPPEQSAPAVVASPPPASPPDQSMPLAVVAPAVLADAPAAPVSAEPAAPAVATASTTPTPAITATATVTLPAAALAPTPVEPPAAAATVEPNAAPAAAEPNATPADGARGTRVAKLHTGADTHAVKATEKLKAKARHRLKFHARRPTPHKKKPVRIARTRIPPSAKTGFPVDVPKPATQASPGTAKSLKDSRQDWN